MAVKDINVQKNANFSKKPLRFALGTSATSQTALLKDAIIPGFAFEIVKVEVFALTIVAVLTVDVQIGAVSALSAPIAPVANTVTAAVVSTTLANRRGTAAEAINLKYTSDGSGASTGCQVTVWVRPLPQNGEVYSI